MNKGIKIYLLDLGVMECHLNLLSPGAYPEDDWGQIPILAVLIDHPTAGKILFDAGCNPEAMNGAWPKQRCEFSPFYHTEEQTMEHQLELCGVRPEEVKTVILSHTHGDHTGYASLFPEANFVINKEEYIQVIAKVILEDPEDPYFDVIRKDVISQPIKRFTLIDGDYELFPGVKLLHLPGHTVGETGVQLELENTGTVILAGDAAHDAYNFGPPVLAPGKCIGFEIYKASMDRIRSITEETGAMIIFGHDMDQCTALKHAPEYYD